MLLEYYRVRASAHPPTRANPSDAGLDVYFNPENATKKINIEPGQSAVLPTGLNVNFLGCIFWIEIYIKSGIAWICACRWMR
jgi:dUTPase